MPSQRQEILDGLSEKEAALLLYDWDGVWARPAQQLPPGDWIGWLLIAGRGYGKTRVGAETVRKWARDFERVNLIGQDPADARDVMVQGESGILACCPPHERPIYRPSLRRLDWPNGATSLIFSGENPEGLRGPQHDKIWADEPAAWEYPQETWDMAMFGLRLGRQPQWVATTTPKPIPLVRQLVASPDTVITTGTTYENLHNLGPAYRQIIRRYEGTRLGRQELLAELLEQVAGALWRSDTIDQHRVVAAPHLDRIVVGVDPSGAADEDTGANEIGIVAAGFSSHEQHGYVISDRSLRAGPHDWASAVVGCYHDLHADVIVAERNFGGEMVRHTIQSVDRNVPVKLVTSSRGKALRAEPVSTMYEQGRVHHVGLLAKLEDQMVHWVPPQPGVRTKDSPDRLDSLVFAITELMVDQPGGRQYESWDGMTEPVRRRGDLVQRGSRYIDK